ncbi:MAG: hypothetical protein JWM12_1215 [Ilumatobacteraceae bacterium]|nr:hypothetical protein [Ilumatobacteraceae bacterium]
MAYLAYDPQRVAELDRTMRNALYGLAFVGCGDPLAQNAAADIRDARRRLEHQWLPFVERINRCAVMTAYNSPAAGGEDLLERMMQAMVSDHGWSIADDGAAPTPDRAAAQAPSLDEVTVLAELLERGDLRDLTDTGAEQTWLATQLTQIAADPLLANRFVATFSRWKDLVNRVGYARMAVADARSADATTDDIVAIASLDAVDHGIAQVIATVHGAGALPDLDGVAPYAAAALVAQAALAADALAAVSDRLLARLIDERPLLGWLEERGPGPKTGDVLFAAILATPGSATPFVTAVAADPRRLWRTAADATLAQRVAAVGTDPANIDVATAGSVLAAFIDSARHPRSGEPDLPHVSGPEDSRAFLGELVGPWLMQFSPFSDEWGSTAPDQLARRDRLAWVVHDGSASDAMFAAQRQIEAGLELDATRRPAEMTAYAGLLGMLTQLVVEQKVHSEEDRKQLWNALWDVTDLVVSIGMAATGIGVVVRPVAKEAMDQAFAHVMREGWFNAPAPKKVREKAEYWQARTFVTAAATMVRAGFDGLRQRGELPPGTPPPPAPVLDVEHPELEYADRYRRWRDRELAGVDPTLISQFDQLKGYFLSDAEAGASIAG